MSGERVARLLVFVLLVGIGWASVSAQNGPPPAPPTPEQARAQQAISRFQERVLENIKKDLGSSDEEFSVLQPKIVKVLELQFQTRAYGGRGILARGRGPAAAILAAIPPSPVQKATLALQDALDRKDARIDDIKSKLSDLRQARATAREELVQAQEDLRQLLTVRQEAALVVLGVLD